MKHLLPVAIICLFLFGIAGAQSVPPVQTINPNQIACNGIGSHGAVSSCNPGWSYGCNVNQVSNQIVATDGQRTSVLVQDTGSNPIVLVFGDVAAGNNGFVIQPANSFLWSNLGAGNIPGRVPTTSMSVIATGISTCVFLFTD